MSTFEQIETEVTTLIAERPLERSRSTDPTAQAESTARSEIKSAANERILFTDHYNFTNGMRTAVINDPVQNLSKWLSRCDDSLTNIKHLLEQNDEITHAQEVKKLEDQREQTIAEAKDKFGRENGYSITKDAFHKAEERYSRMNKAQAGKPPTRANGIWYVLIMAAFSFVEALINYATFNAKYAVPSLAVGSTLLIAVMFAISGHYQGKHLKQRVELMGPNVEKRKKTHHLLILFFATTIGIVAMGAITLVRYQVISDELAMYATGFSLDDAQPVQSAFELLMPFVLMNLLVWLGSIAIAYFLHDSIPEYQEAYKDLKSTRKMFNSLDRKLQEEINRIKAEHDKQLNELVNSTESERKVFKKLEQMAEKIMVRQHNVLRDATVVINDAVSYYQNILVTLAKTNGIEDLKIGFNQEGIDEYRNRNLALSSETLKKMLAA